MLFPYIAVLIKVFESLAGSLPSKADGPYIHQIPFGHFYLIFISDGCFLLSQEQHF